MPLPPYIHEELKDKDRYQTVYAKYNGSSAAPTAGLHFTPELLQKIEEKGIKIANVTLHVGIGTFRPVKEEDVEKHDMHSEHYYIKKEDADKINKAKEQGKKIISVGTTSCRVLESVADISNKKGLLKEMEGDTQIFIYPGYKFKCIDGLITNFHLPQSTLLMLVSALAGKDFVMEAYEKAVKEKYRFFSFGDAMFIKKCDKRGVPFCHKIKNKVGQIMIMKGRIYNYAQIYKKKFRWNRICSCYYTWYGKRIYI